MDASKIVDMLSDRDIWDLLESFGAEPKALGDTFNCRTVCHSGHKHKLAYYRDSKTFYCYTNCGSMSIFDFVSNTLDIPFKEAYNYIAKKYNLHTMSHFEDGFAIQEVVNPGALLKSKMKKVEMPQFKILNDNIIDEYYDFYHKSWIDDGISIETMKKYEIRYNLMDNQIIIPHRDKDGKLIGVRGRNLNKKDVDDGKKYMPIYHNGKVLKHLTGANLYGLDKNKESIERAKTCILFESEKSVQQLDTMFPNASIGLCVSGSNLTQYQLELLKDLEIDEVIVAVDKEFEKIGEEKEIFYADKIKKVFRDKLAPFFRVSVIWDTSDLLDLKDSPSDKGSEVFLKLLNSRIFL